MTNTPTSPAMSVPLRVSAVRVTGALIGVEVEPTSTAATFGEVRDGTADEQPNPSTAASTNSTA